MNAPKTLKIDFVSDVVCPWCAIGLSALEIALQKLEGEVAVELHFQPFELHPDMGPEGAEGVAIAGAADLAGKSVGVTRGAIEDMELSKIAPASADIKRFEDNNATVSAFVSGQVQVIATGASVAGNLMARNPQLGTEFKFVLKDSPNFIGVAKGEDKLRLKVNEIIAAAKASGEIDTMAKKWLGRPAGNLPE